MHFKWATALDSLLTMSNKNTGFFSKARSGVYTHLYIVSKFGFNRDHASHLLVENFTNTHNQNITRARTTFTLLRARDLENTRTTDNTRPEER